MNRIKHIDRSTNKLLLNDNPLSIENIPKLINKNSNREDILKIFKNASTKRHLELKKDFLNESNGLKYSRKRSYVIDQVIRSIFQIATKKFNLLNVLYQPSVLAVGGYGRREMAPHSDIDLLIVFSSKNGSSNEDAIKFILYILWDMGFKVGHAVRDMKECIDLAKADPVIATTLIDMRYIVGNITIFYNLKLILNDSIINENEEYFINAKLKEREERHIKMGDSRYLVEPNIKECKGGLRDLQTVLWIAFYAYGVNNISGLFNKKIISNYEKNVFFRARRFFLGVRCSLHLAAGRLEDRLTFDLQYECAKRLGYSDQKTMQSVERFMKHYFIVAKFVGDLTGTIISSVIDNQAKKRKKKANVIRHKGFVVRNKYILMPKELKNNFDEIKVFKSFLMVSDEIYNLHPDYIRFIRNNKKRIKALSTNYELNKIFIDILTSKKNPGRGLRLMSETGVLGKYLPDFSKIIGQSQFDMYHVYTVDEHLIRAVEGLSELEKGFFAKELKKATTLVKKIKNRKVLFFSVLFHDIAKGRGADHSILGGKIAKNIGVNFRLKKQEMFDLSWLIENHLVLSNIAFKRDIHDIQTIIEFSKIVKRIELLNLLYILTVVDIRATNAGLWNNWKENLLTSLYLSTRKMLEDGKVDTTKKNYNISNFKTYFSSYEKGVVEKYILRFDDYYWSRVESNTQIDNANLIFSANKNNISVMVKFDEKTKINEINIYAKDNKGFFARACGAIALCGGSIVRAIITTTNDGMVVDNFLIHSNAYVEKNNIKENENMKKRILKKLEGAESINEMLKELAPRIKKRTDVFKVKEEIKFDNKSSKSHTILEIVARDKIGLLCAIAQTLYNLNISISSASISTFGEQAMDVFYIRDNAYKKITSTVKMKTIKAMLVRTLKSDFLNFLDEKKSL